MDGKDMALQAFRKIDANCDGTISKDELAVLLMELKPEWSETDVDRLFTAADVDNDGLIDYEEFLAWVFNDSAGQDLLNSLSEPFSVTLALLSGEEKEVVGLTCSDSVSLLRAKAADLYHIPCLEVSLLLGDVLLHSGTLVGFGIGQGSRVTCVRVDKSEETAEEFWSKAEEAINELSDNKRYFSAIKSQASWPEPHMACFVAIMHLLAGHHPGMDVDAAGNPKDVSVKGAQKMLSNPETFIRSLLALKAEIIEGRVPSERIEAARQIKDAFGDAYLIAATSDKSRGLEGTRLHSELLTNAIKFNDVRTKGVAWLEVEDLRQKQLSDASFARAKPKAKARPKVSHAKAKPKSRS